MTKRLPSKLLAVILTLAICATTVFGCLITANAASACCYEWSEGTVDESLTTATINLTFTAVDPVAEDGINAIDFDWSEVDPDAANYLVLNGAEVTGGTPTVTTNGEAFNAEDFVTTIGTNGYSIIVDSEVAYATIELQLTFSFADGAAKQDAEYSVKAENIVLAGRFGEIHTHTGEAVSGVISTSCEHVLTVTGTPLETDTANNYSVYENSVCSKCGETFGYQLVPTSGDITAEEESNSTICWSADGAYDDTLIDEADGTQDGTEEYPIIINSVEELYSLAVRTAWTDSLNKYYKLADGIENVVLQSADKASAIMALSGSAEVNAYFSANAGYSWGAPTRITKNAFAGHFDGNGATFYGLYAKDKQVSGLFPIVFCADEEVSKTVLSTETPTLAGDNVSVSNLNVTNSYIYGATRMGFISGEALLVDCNSYTNYQATTGIAGCYADWYLQVSNCSIYNNYMYSSQSGTGSVVQNGIVAGIFNGFNNYKGDGTTDKITKTDGTTLYSGGRFVSIDNCLVYGNTGATGNGYDIALCGQFSRGSKENSNNQIFTNSIVLGTDPFYSTANGAGSYSSHSGDPSHFSNIYSDALTSDNMTVTYSDASKTFTTDQIMPIASSDVLGSAAVSACPTLAWGSVWSYGAEGEYPSLASGSQNIIYWDGTNTEAPSRIDNGTYIIENAEQLAYIVSNAGPANTSGNKYKIADGIDAIVLQPYTTIAAAGGVEKLMSLSSAADVKEFFTQDGIEFKKWNLTTKISVSSGANAVFNGDFDGNGVEIYGIYVDGSADVNNNLGGLFLSVGGGTADDSGVDNTGVVIENVAVKNSYMINARRMGAIVGGCFTGNYGAGVNGTVTLNNCEVSNNYMRATYTGNEAALMLGSNTSQVVHINNALAYGNDAVFVDTDNNNSETALVLWYGCDTTRTNADGEKILSTVKNSVVLGASPLALNRNNNYNNSANTYESVYTDGDISLGYNLAATDITKLDGADLAKGIVAKTNMPNLAWGSDWYCGTTTGYPVLAPFATLDAGEYSTAELTLIGSNVAYNEDGSFDFNFHYVPEIAGSVPTLYVGTVDASKFMKLDTAVESCYRDQLGDTAIMYTIPNLSARDIDLVWLPTLVTEGSATLEWGKSEQIAIADNARAVLAGDYDQADKNVAAALLNYGAASDAALAIESNDYDAGTIDLLEYGSYLTDMGSSSAYYDSVVADNGETGADWDNAIIIDSAEEFVYLAKGAIGNDSIGKYYKVADGIAGFNLSTSALDLDGTLEENLDVIKGSGKNHSGSTPGFQGYFDGNGVTVYGAVVNGTAYAGLFSCTYGEVTIKNINVKLSYFVGTSAAGGIVGYHKADSMCSVTIENCSVTDSYIETTGSAYLNGVGAVLGYGASAPSLKEATDGVDYNGDGDTADTIYQNVAYNIKNCFVNLDEANFVSPAEDGTEASGERVCHGGIAGVLGSNALTVSDCVVIGITPYATSESTSYNDVQHTGLESHFANVYTTSDVAITGVTLGGTLTNRDFTGKVIPLTDAQLKGVSAKDNMTALDWDTVWTTTSGYPTFINKDYKAAGNRTIYYTGTASTIGTAAPTEGSGTEADPYIINTVEELAYVAGQTPANVANVQGKYFKVADGITSIVLQKADYVDDIIALDSAADTKAYFEANAANMVKWPNYGWEGSTFCGNIDFNGATVYGLYQVSANNAGLFSTIDAGAVISNLGIRNSYITSTNTSYNVGAIAGYSNGSGYAAKLNGVIWVKNATVANNYIYGAHDTTGDNNRVGVLYGSISDNIYTDNILVYGNDATYGAGYKAPAMASAGNAIPETVEVPEGLVVKYAGTNSSGEQLHTNVIRNSIILGCTPYDLTQQNGSRFNDLTNCYENVYTDADIANDTFSNGTAASGIKGATQLTDLNTLKGDSAQAIVDTFNTANGSTVWYVGNEFDYPGFEEATGAMPSNVQALYDSMVLSTYDTVGDGTMYHENGSMSFGVYATSLNLKVNPYMAFTFAFLGEYKQSENVAVTFKSGDTVITTVTAAEMVNNEGAGRYHLYRLKDVPVMALSTGITVTASISGGAEVDLGTYSAEGFALLAEKANKIEPCDYYATRYEAAKALLFYTDMLVARYGA